MQKAYLHTTINLRALKPLLLLLLFSSLSIDAWGDKTNQGTITILSGKGTVEIDAYYKYFGSYYHNTNSTSTLNASMTVAKTKHNTDDGWVKFTATANEGYTFYGWCTNSDCSDNSPDKTNPKEYHAAPWYTLNVTLYTKFTPNKYDVTLSPNGGTGNNQTVQATYDAAMPSKIKNSNNSITAPSREGYIFAGYYDTDAATGGKKYYNADLTSANNWDKTSATTLYARWTANTYTVVFNGNDNTSGSMSNESFTFDAAKSLTSNAYNRIYTVSYDADGGSTASTTDANTKATYTFNGWEDRNSIKYNGTTYTYATFDAPYYANTYGDLYAAFGYNKYSLVGHYVVYGNGEGRSCKGATPGLYPNGASVANLTTEANGTVTLYANWTSGSVTLPNATRENHVIEGWYKGPVDNPENKVGVPGDSYTPTENTMLTAKWIEQYPFTMSGSNYDLFVGDTEENAYTFTYAENPQVHISPAGIISYSNEAITALAEGVATIYFTQENTNTITAGESEHWTVTVSRVANTLALNTSSDTKYVTQTVDNVLNLSTKNSTADIETSSSVAGMSNDDAAKIAYYDVANNKIVIPNSQSESFTTKEVTIKIWQAQNVKYTASGEKTFTLTVNKYQTSFSGSAYNLMVDGIQSEAYSYTNTSAATPTNDSNDDFYYTIDDIKFDSVALNKGENFVTYNPTGSQITACNAGTGKITFHQKETYKYTGAETSFDVTVSKHDPLFEWDGDKEVNYTFNYPHNTTKANIFTTNSTTAYTIVSDNEYSAKVEGVASTNTLEVYNVAEDAHITITQEENYRWKGQTKEYTIHPTNPNNHVPFTMTNENVAAIQKSVSNNVVWNGSDNYYKLGKGVWGLEERPDESVKIGFTGIPDKLYFSINADKAGVQVGPVVMKYYPAKNDYEFYVYESATGNDDDWHQLDWGFSNNDGFEASYLGGNESKRHIQVALSATTRFVKFRYKGSCWGRFENIRVTELNKFDADKEDINFGTQGEKYGTQVNTLNFSHANAGRTTTVTVEGEDAGFFEVTPSTIPGTGRDLSGMTTCRVAFNNNEDRRDTEYQAELVFVDNLGHEERVPLKGRRSGKCYPEYTWNPNHLPYYFNSTIAHVAVSSNTDYENCPMTYESSDPTIAYVDEAGNLHILEKSGSVTITVKQVAENNDYKPGSASFTFTPRERPNLAVPFQVTNVVYNEAVEAGDWCYWENSDGGRVRAGGSAGGVNILTDDWVWENDKKVFTLAFNETPEKLSFEYRNNNMGFLINSTKPEKYHMWEVFESADGVTWHSLWSEDSQHKEWTKVSDVQLAETTQYIKFVYWGNYEGYWRNINVTSFDGYKFLREEENNQYLSRGSNWGTRAVVDAFGIATRVTRSTPDNVNYYAQFQFVDNENFLFEDYNHEIYTDYWADGDGKNTKVWKATVNNDLWKFQSTAPGSDGKYITLSDGILTLTNEAGNAAEWYLENYAQHTSNITKMLDEQAVAAASSSDLDFPNVTTLAGVRDELNQHGYEFTTINLPALSATAQSWEGRSSSPASPVYANEITDLVPGFYHLQVKAFMRVASAEVSYSIFNRGVESVVAYAYANKVKYPVKSIFDETGRRGVQFGAGEGTGRQYPDGYYYADDLTAANVAFANENGYVSDVYVYVPADAGKTTGTLRYGIMSPSYVEGAWMVYSNITLRHLDRAQYIFDGTDSEDKENWQEYENWDRGDKPNEDNAVIIRSDVTIAEEVSVYSVTIENNAKVTITPTGGLTVGKGGVKGATTENLILKAGTADKVKGQTGFLRIHPESAEPMPEATVELFSIGYYDKTRNEEDIAAWQYVGTPIDFNGALAKTVFTRSWIYSYVESSGSWVNNRSSLVMQPFSGYKTTQYDDKEGKLLIFKGRLISNESVHTKELNYTEGNGYNLVANSFAAPIDITQFSSEDFVNVEKTIYIYNTGSRKQYLSKAAQTNSPGQYTPISIGTVDEMNEYFQKNSTVSSTIAPMQGFFVKATRENAQLKFDYNKLVWGADLKNHPNNPLRAPKRSAQNTSISAAMKITMEADSMSDEVYMLESEQYELEYEDGYDAHKLESGEFNIYTVRDEEQLAIDATSDFAGTQIGVRTGKETSYTMHFSNLYGERNWSLVDVEAGQTIDINEGTQYTFFIEPQSTNNTRFRLIERNDSNEPSTPTGVDNIGEDAKVHKFIKDNQLFILKNGVLYTGTGARVE